jgi:hypothetical protein
VRGGAFTEATDVFGLGCVLFNAATRREPGAGVDADHDRPPPVRTLRRLPGSLAEAIDAVLSHAPEDRPRVRELAAACAAAAD